TACVCQATDELGRVAEREPRVSGIDALGRIGEVVVLAAPKPTPIEDVEHQTVRCAGYDGGFNDDQLARTKVIADGFDSHRQGSEIGSILGVKGGWHADHDDRTGREALWVRGGAKPRPSGP